MLRVYCKYHRILLTDLSASEEYFCLLEGRKCENCPYWTQEDDGFPLPDDTLPFDNWKLYNGQNQ